MNKSSKELNFLKSLHGGVVSPNNYTYEEIKKTFSKTIYTMLTLKEKEIYKKVLEELKPEKLDDFCKEFDTNKIDIKKLYINSLPEQSIEILQIWNKRFNLPKTKSSIKKRAEEPYCDMDGFEPYELTPCIAYEMAIRNKDVKALLQRYDKISEMLNDDQYIFSPYAIDRAFRKEQTEEDTSLYLKKQHYYEKSIEQDYKNFIDNIYKCTELDIVILSKLTKKLENELINEYLIYPTGYQRKIPNLDLFVENIDNKQKKEESICYNKNESYPISDKIVYKECILWQGLYTTKDKYFINHILPNFKRQVNDQNQITMPINLSLPLEEIMEYIKRVKKRVNPKTPYEFLEKELKKADNIKNLNIKSEQDNVLTLDVTKGEKKENKAVDMLYIYDMRQLGFKYKEITNQIDCYYNYDKTNRDLNENFKSTDIKTARKFFSIAKDYIENKRYKELITGKILDN